MARTVRKIARKSPGTPKKAQPTSVAVRVVVGLDDVGEPFYANYAEVTAGQYDAELTFARVPTKPTPDQLAGVQQSGELVVPATVRVVLPHEVLIGLRDAIAAQVSAIESRKE
jgi:hypothetical protein